jgi:very-short-patch-repair endonuclease
MGGSASTWRCRSRSTASEHSRSTCCADARVAIELDGGQHADPVTYRRDRRKDQLLQENGYFVLRFLAEDVGKELDAVLDAILRVLVRRRQPAIAEPLKFVRRGGQ